LKDDFAEAADPREEEEQPAAAPPPLAEAPPPAESKTPGLNSVLKRARPVVERVAGVTARGLTVTGRTLRRFFKKDSVPNLVLVMFLLTVVTASCVGIVVSVTEDRIAEGKAESFAEALGTVFPGLELTFAPSGIGENIYEGRDGNGQLAGFSILVSPKGFSGFVDMVVGVDTLREVTGVTVVRHRETGDYSAVLTQGISEALAALDRGLQP